MGKVVSQSPPEEEKGKLRLLHTGTQPRGGRHLATRSLRGYISHMFRGAVHG